MCISELSFHNSSVVCEVFVVVVNKPDMTAHVRFKGQDVIGRQTWRPLSQKGAIMIQIMQLALIPTEEDEDRLRYPYIWQVHD